MAGNGPCSSFNVQRESVDLNSGSRDGRVETQKNWRIWLVFTGICFISSILAVFYYKTIEDKMIEMDEEIQFLKINVLLNGHQQIQKDNHTKLIRGSERRLMNSWTFMRELAASVVNNSNSINENTSKLQNNSNLIKQTIKYLNNMNVSIKETQLNLSEHWIAIQQNKMDLLNQSNINSNLQDQTAHNFGLISAFEEQLRKLIHEIKPTNEAFGSVASRTSVTETEQNFFHFFLMTMLFLLKHYFYAVLVHT